MVNLEQPNSVTNQHHHQQFDEDANADVADDDDDEDDDDGDSDICESSLKDDFDDDEGGDINAAADDKVDKPKLCCEDALAMELLLLPPDVAEAFEVMFIASDSAAAIDDVNDAVIAAFLCILSSLLPLMLLLLLPIIISRLFLKHLHSLFNIVVYEVVFKVNVEDCDEDDEEADDDDGDGVEDEGFEARLPVPFENSLWV